MIRMIATTISNSINEKPFCFRIRFLSSFRFSSNPFCFRYLGLSDPVPVMFALDAPLQLITKVRGSEMSPLQAFQSVPDDPARHGFVPARLFRHILACSMTDCVTSRNAQDRLLPSSERLSNLFLHI